MTNRYDLIKIQEKLQKKLTPDRYQHTLGVMYTCAALAMCHGCNLERAMVAGLLHDCAKCIPNDKKISICEKNNIAITEAERKNPSLLHAKAGVFLAKSKYDIEDEDILDAISKVNADNIFVLPNNGNIILAANQAKNLTEDKEVYVVPSKNIPQGIAAMISFVSGRSAAENAESMEEEMQLIKSGQVTYAVRDTNMDGKDIKQGDFMGLTDKTIVSVGSDLQGTAKELIESLLDEDSELVSLYYGSDATKEQAEQLAEDIENTHEDVEVEVQYGGQPVYSYFISVE